MATGGDDRVVNVWRVTNAANFWSLQQNKTPITSVAFDPTEGYVISGTQGGTIKVFDLETVSLCASGLIVAAIVSDVNVPLARQGKVSRTFDGHKSDVTCLHYHPYGDFMISDRSTRTSRSGTSGTAPAW
jgi:katanin p80 WD40 repeat-containing subunit B1